MKPVLAVRHVAHEGLGTIGDALRRKEVPVEIVDAFEAPPSESGDLRSEGMRGRETRAQQRENCAQQHWQSQWHPAWPKFDPQSVAGLIVMGGPMNVDEVEKYPFLAEEVRWLQRAVEVGLPVLGVCLGAQLLAKALGAKVYPNRIKEIGWYEVELLETVREDLLFRGVADLNVVGRRGLDPPYGRMTVFQWHGDTFDLPNGAVPLARSELCENQAFRYGAAAYGLQFHLEVTVEIIESWLCEGGNCGELAGLSYIDPAEIRRQTPQKLPGMQAMGRVVFDRFLEMVRKGY